MDKKQNRGASVWDFDDTIAKTKSGVLAKITSNLNEEGISIETILQIPDKNISQEQIPIIIVTHATTKNFLKKL